MSEEDYIVSSSQNINVNELWEKALEKIDRKVTEISFDVWIATIEPVEIKGNTLVLATPSLSSRKVLNQNYKSIIVGCLNEVHSAITGVEFVVGNAKDVLAEPEEDAENADNNQNEQREETNQNVFNEDLTLDPSLENEIPENNTVTNNTTNSTNTSTNTNTTNTTNTDRDNTTSNNTSNTNSVTNNTTNTSGGTNTSTDSTNTTRPSTNTSTNTSNSTTDTSTSENAGEIE